MTLKMSLIQRIFYAKNNNNIVCFPFVWLYHESIGRDFFYLMTDGQVRKFHEYDLETQYSLLIVGNQVLHPPALHLTGEFAKNGKSVIPFLYEKLTVVKQERTVRDIVMVLSDMQRLGFYNVRGDSDLMALAAQRVAAMEGVWKSIAQRAVEGIYQYPSHQ